MSEIIFKSFITNWCVKVYEAEMDKINYNIIENKKVTFSKIINKKKKYNLPNKHIFIVLKIFK